MPAQTIRSFLEFLENSDWHHRAAIEEQSIDIGITSRDYTPGITEDQVHGDVLIERGQGWKLEVSHRFSFEDVLNGIGDTEGLLFDPYLTYRSYGYFWPEAGKFKRGLTIEEIKMLLEVLSRAEFPHEYFDEEEYGL